MAKHFIGFGLFALIVSAFVALTWIFSAPALKTVTPAFELPPKIGTYCDKKRRLNPTSPGAIANRHNGELTLYLHQVPGGRANTREFRASFAFYVVNGEDARLAGVVNDSLVNHTSQAGGPKWILQYNAEWIKQLSWDDNVYVVPATWEEGNDSYFTPEFSRETALPVVIRN